MTKRQHTGLFERLESEMDQYTSAERAVANFILTNRNTVAFETAASVAEKLGVSPVTVGRFCRRLGYQHFKDLKAELKVDIAGVPWLMGDQLATFVEHGPDVDHLKHSLELSVAGLVEVYSMAQTQEWDDIVTLLAKASVVHVAGFQTERGFALHFAHLLQYVRTDVHPVDLTAGNYADVLADDRPNRCLVVIETRRYSKHAYMLCEMAQAEGVDIIIVTDKYCDWARRFTPHVLAISTESELFWNSLVPLSGALNLLANSVVSKMGPGVEARLAKFSKLYQEFSGHVGHTKRSSGSQ